MNEYVRMQRIVAVLILAMSVAGGAIAADQPATPAPTPAEIPKKPRKPNVFLVSLGGVVAAVLLAFGAAALADLRSGRFIEPWQVRRKLKLPVLGSINLPRSQ